jgi:hypothetical protein
LWSLALKIHTPPHFFILDLIILMIFLEAFVNYKTPH